RPLRERSRQGGELADEGPGTVDAAGRDESPAAEACRHLAGGAPQARAHRGRDPRPEAGRGLNVSDCLTIPDINFSGENKWPFHVKKSSTRLATSASLKSSN